jgi:hypothetical protein
LTAVHPLVEDAVLVIVRVAVPALAPVMFTGLVVPKLKVGAAGSADG